jgi:transcription termination factor NusB
VVDRCILYIALYELEYNKLDTPIVVSEANALADAYSGGKSAPFIHGVISAAAKACSAVSRSSAISSAV